MLTIDVPLEQRRANQTREQPNDMYILTVVQLADVDTSYVLLTLVLASTPGCTGDRCTFNFQLDEGTLQLQIHMQ